MDNVLIPFSDLKTNCVDASLWHWKNRSQTEIHFRRGQWTKISPLLSGGWQKGSMVSFQRLWEFSLLPITIFTHWIHIDTSHICAFVFLQCMWDYALCKSAAVSNMIMITFVKLQPIIRSFPWSCEKQCVNEGSFFFSSPRFRNNPQGSSGQSKTNMVEVTAKPKNSDKQSSQQITGPKCN